MFMEGVTVTSTNPAISRADEAHLDELYQHLKAARSDVNHSARGYRNAVLTDDDRMREDFRQLHAEAAAHYNQIVADINTLTEPHRIAQRAANKAAAVARREAAQERRRAQFRAGTCATCGLAHRGEC